MFAKSKVSQSMIDAVNKVLGEQPTQTAQPVQPVGVKEELLNEGWDDMVKDAKEKVKSGPKPSGGAGKKEGSRYGGSKQKDEKEPVKEELKGNQTKIDKNKNNKIDAEDFKLLRKEELKGNQTKIDANHNNKIDGQDFAILRGKKKKMREHLNDMPFAKKLLEKELDEGLMKKAFKALTGGSDKDHLDRLKKSMYGKDSEVKYAAKTLVKHAKDPLGLKKEEVEGVEEAKAINDLPNRGMLGTDTEGPHGVYRSSGTNLKIVSKHKTLDSALKHVDKLRKKSGKADHFYGHLSSHGPDQGKIPNHFHEEVEQQDEALIGNQKKIDKNHNNKIDAQDFKILRSKKVDEVLNPSNKTIDTLAGRSKKVPAEAKLDNSHTSAKTQLKAEAKTPEHDDVPFDPPYRRTSDDDTVTDKSGAKHTPMSRAKHLAQTALQRVKSDLKAK